MKDRLNNDALYFFEVLTLSLESGRSLKNALEVTSNNIEYRNKISLHIKNYKIGYYQASTNELVEITKCNIAMPVINEFLKYLKGFKIKDGSVSIRCNDTNELLIYIKTVYC